MTFDNHIAITPQLVADHGLKLDEYQKIIQLIGRAPTYTELGIFSAMWNEHCSYKSSKKWLRTLPTTGQLVIQGRARMPASSISATGRRSCSRWSRTTTPATSSPTRARRRAWAAFCATCSPMGARPVAAMNALRFGAPEHEKTQAPAFRAWSAGVGGYGNSFGVPTVGRRGRVRRAL